MSELKIGKLDSQVLKSIVIDKIKFKRPEVKTGAGIGEDCAVVDFGPYECVISTDPITADVKDIGKLAIHISCNDIASNGIEPLGITLAVMLPPGTTESDISMIMAQAGQAAEDCGVEIIGGHTEITDAVKKPVIVSTAFGRGTAGASQKAQDMKPGDVILMTKTAGLEGTGIIGSDYESQLGDVITEDELRHAKDLLRQVSVVAEGVACGRIGTSGMHDVTEGGIFGAVWEMCHIAGLGCEVEVESIPVDPVTEKIADHFGIDVMRLISSGSMLIIATASKAYKIVTELDAMGIKCSVIGKICGSDMGVMAVHKDGRREIIEPPEADELYKVVK